MTFTILLAIIIVLILTSTASAVMGGDPSVSMNCDPIKSSEINIVADCCRYF